ncbi:MAG: ATP synthase F0 subunit C [Candidatus Omnitrophica bacterium]|jgi:F-type H+-transporting ATPase subunit c|nr:ATP synthase F0 subunit C [Candidatus Omnitrophota bacterium]
MRNLLVILIMFLATLGPAAVIGVVGYAAVRAVGRNPSASPRILLAMIMAFIFAEAIAVMAILIVFGLFK